MSVDLAGAIARVVAIQKEAMTSISVTCDAVPYFYHFQEFFPYFTNRPGDDTIGFDSEDFDRDTYTIIMRLVVGHVTDGYVGENEANLYTYIPTVKTYFNQREGLEHAGATTCLNGLIRARITSISGYRIFQNAGIAVLQVGTELTLTCEFDETIEQQYS